MTPLQLKRFRKARGNMTQVQAGEVFGVSGNTIARWEREEVPISETASRLYDCLIRRPTD